MDFAIPTAKFSMNMTAKKSRNRITVAQLPDPALCLIKERLLLPAFNS